MKAKNLLLLVILFCSNILLAQSSKKQVLVDIAHGQKFYNDPARMEGKDTALVTRIKYMTGELKKNAAAQNAEVSFQSGSLTTDALAKINLLFLHMPGSKYSTDEVKAIGEYLNRGGSLFIVMEENAWATLEQVNVNDIVSPFGIVFKEDSPNKQTGGYSKEGSITKTRFSIPHHGARLVEGGTPFCYSVVSEEQPFGVYKEVGKGGKIIAMGEGMVSLYMTSWQGVNNYQCAEFMGEVVAWLLK
jgi:hypothetical protein